MYVYILNILKLNLNILFVRYSDSQAEAPREKALSNYEDKIEITEVKRIKKFDISIAFAAPSTLVFFFSICTCFFLIRNKI